VEAERVLAFRLARSGLAARSASGWASAAACPASDFARDAALLALAARFSGVTREGFVAAVDAGEVVVAHVVRGAIHAVAPDDHALFGPALVADDDAELGVQLGRQVQRLAGEHGFAPTEALAEVTDAVRDALAGGEPLGKDALHAALRARVRSELMPWCQGCGSHHVAPMLWRYATVAAGVRLDARRRYRAGPSASAAGAGARRSDAGPSASAAGATAPRAGEAVRRFLRVYGPSTPRDFAAWAGLARPHAQRLWDAVAPELAAVGTGRDRAWLLRDDLGALDDPPAAQGVRLLPPGDPYLQGPNRPLLAPDKALRARLFRPVASPGALLVDGRLAGLWRARAKGRKTEVTVEPLGRVPRGPLEDEARRVAELRGASDLALVMA